MLVILIAVAKWPASRFSRVRWIARGYLVLVPGRLLSSLSDHHNWPHQQAIIASDIEGISLLAFFACLVTFLVTDLKRSPKRPIQSPRM